MEPEAHRHEDPGNVLGTWRTVIVPVFGPLWVVLPLLVWFAIFGSDLIEIVTGSRWLIVKAVVLLAIVAWAIFAWARMKRAYQSTHQTFPWSLVARTALVLLVQLSVGTVFFFVIMSGVSGMLKDWPPAPRALVGACITALAWMGWSGITPQSRRLALGSLRRLGKKT